MVSPGPVRSPPPLVTPLSRRAEASTKYSNSASNFISQRVAVENLGTFSTSTLKFLSDLGHKLSSFSGEKRAPTFPFQRHSVSLQRFNSVLLHDIRDR